MYLDISLNITGAEKDSRKTRSCGRHRHVWGQSIRAVNEWIRGNLYAVWLLFLKCIWDGVGDTFQLQYKRPGAKVNCSLLTRLPWNEHNLAIRNVRVRKQGYAYGRRPQGMVGVYLGALRSPRNSLHHLSNLWTNGRFSYQTASAGFTLKIFWILEERCARWI